MSKIILKETVTHLRSEDEKSVRIIPFNVPEGINKLFITYYQGKHVPFYGYMFYHTETHRFVHKYFVSAEFGELAVALNKSFNTIYKWLVK